MVQRLLSGRPSCMSKWQLRVAFKGRVLAASSVYAMQMGAISVHSSRCARRNLSSLMSALLHCWSVD